jgi:dihydrofolate synthase/folylpolyglutamate synthase
MEEILAEAAVLHLALEIAAGRGDDANVDRDLRSAADTLELLLDENAEHLAQRLKRHVRDLVDVERTAVRLLEEVRLRGQLSVSTDALKTALADTRWPGRLERRRWASADLLLDGAHNPSGARALASYVLETFKGPLPMVVGVMKDKDVPAVIESLAPAASHFVLTAASSSSRPTH